MSNIEILETPHREYDADRDWLVPDQGLRKPTAKVITFSPKLLQCFICGQRTHRSSSCPLRPRVKSPSTA